MTAERICRVDIDPLYAERWSTTEVGKRGGLRCPGTRPHVTVPWHGYFAELLQWYKVRWPLPAHTRCSERRASTLMRAGIRAYVVKE